MGKPQPKRFNTDDCVVIIDDTVYHPHEGEWVEMFPIASVGEFQVGVDLGHIQTDLDAIKGEPDEDVKAELIMDRAFDELCEYLADRIVDWNWTDLRGRPLPKPDGTVKPLKKLLWVELVYLHGLTGGETPTDRKNASEPSVTTSSATASPETAEK